MELSIEQALRLGQAAYIAGDLEEAERLYRVVLAAQANHAEANHGLGLITNSTKGAKTALSLYKTALEADPDQEKYWLSYIDALVNVNHAKTALAVLRQGRTMGLSGKNIDAVETRLKELLQSTATQAPSSSHNSGNETGPSRQQIGRLVENYRSGQIKEALRLAIELTQNFPEHQFGWKVLGVLHGQAGRYADAVIAHQKAVLITPDDDEAHCNLGNTLREMGRLIEAETSCRRAIALNPGFAGNHSNFGVTLQDMGRQQEAEACYRKAIALEPNFAEAHSNLASVLREQGKIAEAEISCRKLISLEPKVALAHNNLGILQRELGKIEEAQASFKRAIALDPEFADPYNGLGGTLRELGKLNEAEASYKRALALQPGFALAHCNLAVTLKDLGKLEEAKANCQHTLALAPNFAEAHYNLGVLLFEQEQYQEAAEHFAQVDIHQSKLFAIKCSYHVDEESVFSAKLDSLVSAGEINAVIGSLSCCAKSKYGIDKPNPFCSDPLAYVFHTDLNTQCDFERVFIKTAHSILQDPTVSHKDQVHLSSGVQTAGNFFALEQVTTTEIEKIIYQEIERYLESFKNSNEGLIKHWPASYEISGWLVSMESGGSLTAHMHDTGWITGSIYINVPPKAEKNSGNLVLRVSDQAPLAGEESSQEKIVDVQTGSLCFFPSSLLHHTIPFKQDENRIVLAFDVIPKR